MRPRGGGRGARSWRHGRLAGARIAWLHYALIMMGFTVAGLPAAYAGQQQLCPAGAACPLGVDPGMAQALAQVGLSLRAYAAWVLVQRLVLIMVFWLVAWIIFLARPRERMALFTAAFLLGFGSSFLPAWNHLFPGLPWAWLVFYRGTTAVALTFLFVLFYVFPDGRFVPRWTRWITLPAFLFSLASTMEWSVADTVLWPVPILLLFCGLAAQVYRYRQVSDWHQRRQTRWVVYGAGLAVGGSVGLITPGYFLPEARASIWHLIIALPLGLAFMLIPLSIGIAILRSGLWDIDVIIRRTLVYAVLTALLALIYFGSVVLLQSVLEGMSGQRSPAAIVFSTLLIAALASPLRRRVQGVIDRRFYRQKYNAAQTLAAFASRARDETDLDALLAELARVVSETIRPTEVILWLRAGDR